MITHRICLAAPFPVAWIVVTLLIAVTKYQGVCVGGGEPHNLKKGRKVSSGCELRKCSPLLWGKHGSSHVRQLGLSHAVREQMAKKRCQARKSRGPAPRNPFPQLKSVS